MIAFNPLVRGSYVKSLHAAANLNLLDEEIVKDFIRARRKDMNRYRPSKTTWLEVYDIM